MDRPMKRGEKNASVEVNRNRRILKNIQKTLDGAINGRAKRTEVLPEHDLGPPKSIEELLRNINDIKGSYSKSRQDLSLYISSANVEWFSENELQKLCDYINDTAFDTNDFSFSIDLITSLINCAPFQKVYGNSIDCLMSSYRLCRKEIKNGLLQYLAFLLVADWPRKNSKSSKESNFILYIIISHIKEWIETISDEEEDDEEMVSLCGAGLCEIFSTANRRVWIKWPELTDETFMAIRSSLSSNICMKKEIKLNLFDLTIKMQSWTRPNTKSFATVSTQTISKL